MKQIIKNTLLNLKLAINSDQLNRSILIAEAGSLIELQIDGKIITFVKDGKYWRNPQDSSLISENQLMKLARCNKVIRINYAGSR